MDNGNSIGGFVCDNDLAGSNCTHMVYEADAKGNEVARVRIPASHSATHTSGAAGQAYRALPLKTLRGEGHM